MLQSLQAYSGNPDIAIVCKVSKSQLNTLSDTNIRKILSFPSLLQSEAFKGTTLLCTIQFHRKLDKQFQRIGGDDVFSSNEGAASKEFAHYHYYHYLIRITAIIMTTM